MLHWDIQKTQPIRPAKQLGKNNKVQISQKPIVKVEPLPILKPILIEPKEPNEVLPQPQTILMSKILVVFVAHIWNNDIDVYFKSLKQSCAVYNIDLVILACGTRFESEEKIFRPSLDEIKLMYSKNFHAKGLWACNHWILLWLWKVWAKEECYDHVWSIEYDVRTLGDLYTLWSLDTSIDYVSSTSIQPYSTEGFWGPNIGFRPTHTALKQIFRCSYNFLNYLDEKCREGLTGQDECTLATHAQQFKYTNLKSYLCAGYSPQKNDAILRLWQNEKKQQTKMLKIFHPIK